MHIPFSRKNDAFLYWLAAALLLVSFFLADATVLAWSASIATFGQLTAIALAFALISLGALFTVGLMKTTKR